MQGFSKGVTGENNILQLTELGADLAEKVLQYWMGNINRTLTNYQVRHLPIYMYRREQNFTHPISKALQ